MAGAGRGRRAFLRRDLVECGARRRRCPRTSRGGRRRSRAACAPRTAVIAPSHAFAAMLRSAYGDRWPLRVVHNGRSLPLPRPRLPRGQHVFTAGRLWDEGKNARTARCGGRDSRSCRSARRGRSPARTARDCGVDNLHLLGVLDADAMAHELASAAVFASAGALRAVRPRRARSGASGLRAGALRHSRPFANCGTAPRYSSTLRRCGRVCRGAARRAATTGRSPRRWAAPPAQRAASYAAARRWCDSRDSCDARRSRALRERRAPRSAGMNMRSSIFTHSLASVLESRQRAFPARRAARADRARPLRCAASSRIDGWSRTNLVARSGRAEPGRVRDRLSRARTARASRSDPTSTRCSMARIWCSCMNGTTRRWSRAIGGAAAPRRQVHAAVPRHAPSRGQRPRGDPPPRSRRL